MHHPVRHRARDGRRPAVTTVTAALAGLLIGLLAGCGTEAATVGGRLGVAPSSPGVEGRRIDLVVTLRDRPGSAATTWTLTCSPNGGSHPDKDAACEALLAAGGDPWAAVPAGRACTEATGDERVASVTGLWFGVRTSASFDRTSDCEIDRWDTIGPVLDNGAPDGEESASVSGEVDGPDPAMVPGGAEGDEAVAGG